MNAVGPPVRLYNYAPGLHIEQGDALWAGIWEGSALISDGGYMYDVIAKQNKLIHLGMLDACEAVLCGS